VAIMPPLDDTAAQDLKTVQTLVPMGLRISLAEAYKRFRWRAPAPGEECLSVAEFGNGLTSAKGAGGTPATATGTVALPEAEGNGEGDPLSVPSPRTGGARVGKPIGAGARNGEFQTASGAMPDPQVDAASFYSNQP